MKKIISICLLLLVGFFLIKNLYKENFISKNMLSDFGKNGTQTLVPTQNSATSGLRQRAYLSDKPVPSILKIEKNDIRTIQDLLRLSRKTLKSKEETESYQNALKDKEKIDLAYNIIQTIPSITSNDDFLNNQKLRMDAVLFLMRAFEWLDNPQGKYIKETVASLILDDSISKTQDLKLRKSMAADRIELFANLKYVDREAAIDIQNKASEKTTKKIIQFANNFYKSSEK
jgi:hypothetical protein